MVEHVFCKHAVAGSNPIAGSTFANLSTAWWCNGSTNDSDSFCLGSSPSRAANLKGRSCGNFEGLLFSKGLYSLLAPAPEIVRSLENSFKNNAENALLRTTTHRFYFARRHMWVDTLVLMNTHPLSLAFPDPKFRHCAPPCEAPRREDRVGCGMVPAHDCTLKIPHIHVLIKI